MSRQRTLIRNVLKRCPKAWLPLLAVGMSASVFSNQLPQGAQISQQSSTALVLGAGGDAERAAHNVMPAQLSAQRRDACPRQGDGALRLCVKTV